MYSFDLNKFQYNNYSTAKPVKSITVEEKKCKDKPVAYDTNPIMREIPFNPTFSASNFRTELISKAEKEKYNAVVSMADKDTKKRLHTLLKTGVLLNSDSNDNSTTLDNIYKIVANPRVQGLTSENILKETVMTLYDPHVITQQFGNIPSKYQAKVASIAQPNPADANVEHSGTCTVSSIEFNMAQKHPAEFARFVEGLSSPAMQVDKTIKLSNLADSTLEAVWLLNAFDMKFETNNFNEAKLKFAPDKNAIIRAHIQTVDKDASERSSVDVLMQSTLMQIGSQQSYDTLTDKRAGKFNQNDKGLIEFEKTFTESVVDDKNKISMTYQKIDENAKLTGYETDFDTIKRHIKEALDMGENVIIGYTQVDGTNTVINGHEITITGIKKDKNGKLIFVCNDTDDGINKSVEYTEDFLLPKIHHATLPQVVASKDIKLTPNWVESLNKYKEMKNAA